MKSFAIVLFVAQAVIFQNAYAQCLRSLGPNFISQIAGPAPTIISAPSPCGCGNRLVAAPSVVAAPSIVAAPSVANSLADTLSLLTVSSLLAETLPLGYSNVIGLPTASPMIAESLPLGYPGVIGAPAYSVGGCGCGCGGYSSYFI